MFPQWGSTKATVFVSGVPTQVDSDSRNLAFDGSFGLTRILVPHVGATGEAYFTRITRSFSNPGPTRDYTTNSFGARFGLSVFLY